MDRKRLPLVVGTTIVLVIAIASIAVAVDRANQANLNATTPAATPPPTPTPAPASFADCSKVRFGSPLEPRDQPRDLHRYSAPPSMQIDSSKLYLVTITSAKGMISICIQPELAPQTANNFVVLARNHFYDGLLFHRIVPDFVVQGGDPDCTSEALAAGRCGGGGPGYKFSDEPVQADYLPGAVAMANSGPNTNGSQFFVCTTDDRQKLQKKYNLFGRVARGMDVVAAIAQGDVMQAVTVAEQS